MKVYNAWAGPLYQLPSLLGAAPVRLLISFAYDNGTKPYYEHIASFVPLDEVSLMMDSGAFSVWTTGKTIDLDAYIEWAKVRQPMFKDCVTINLDVIPGSPGVQPTGKERRYAIRQSMENADQMRAAGLPVMEVFHLFDGSFKVMEDLWARRRPGEVFGIGGLVGAPQGETHDFCDQVFARLRDWNGGSWDNIVKLHGLGVSPDSPAARRYPWWSVDSSSWSTFHRYGYEVGRAGRSQKTATGLSSGITSVRPAYDLYYIRIAKRWRRLEGTLTALWNQRGVSFLEERTAA